jgi:hypothetical protein
MLRRESEGMKRATKESADAMYQRAKRATGEEAIRMQSETYCKRAMLQRHWPDRPKSEEHSIVALCKR